MQRVAVAGPAVLVALLPKCPACWSVYAGVSSALGVNLTLDDPYSMPLTASLIGLALVALAKRTLSRGRLAHFCVGAVAAIGIVVGKFAWSSDWLTHGAALLLLAACLWRGRKARPGTTGQESPEAIGPAPSPRSFRACP